jgi:glucose/arabinose dehydrogenase
VLQAATLPTGFAETQIASLSNGTAMAFAPDGRLFVCQQTGELRVIKNGALLATPFVTLAVDSSGERGLLGVAFDLDFATNQFVYVYYTATTPAIHNRVSRFTSNGDVAVANSEVVMLDLNNLSGATNHNGGAIHFGTDGKLYIAVGENANPANAQTLTNLLGKMLRINPDPDPANLVPSDNPFFNDPNVVGNNKAIWALGLRNPFTFGFQPGTGRLFINDVGQSAWEEINDGIAGSNYGWNSCEGACGPPPNPNFRDPIFQYANDASTCAIVGGAFYNPPSPQFPSVFIGKYFYADLCGGWIHRFDPANNTSAGFATGLSSPVDLQVASDGSLYYLVRGGGGAVFRIFTMPTAVSSVRFTADSYILDESAGSITIMVTRSGDTSLAATVDYMTSDGTADQRVDYTSTAGTLRFAPFETSQTLNVLITDDGYVESDETVNIGLSNPTGGIVLGAPATAVLHIGDNDIVAPTTNPAEDARFFVRQQYHDFLNREPDQNGWDYWTNQLTQCGMDQLCLHRRRIGVSDAFFFEPEFQETGSYVYRVYKAAFGNRPSYALFMADRSRVIAGPLLAQSKADFAAAFVQRPAFTSQYPASMTAAQYVDALNASSGNPLTAAQRDALVNGLIAGTDTRASVLRKIADTQTFVDREYNSAFVLMEYFVYLRRDPDQGGFDFWFFQVNQFPPRNVVAQYAMVCAFLTSREYQERFSSIVTRSNAQCGQ